MAESVVACPGCEKKFRIKDASQPGQFQCTACKEIVSYGQAAAARPARPAGRGRPAARGARPGRARPAGRGRARRGGYDDGEGPPPKSNTALYVVLAVVAVVVVGGILAFVLMQDDGPPEVPYVPKPVADANSGNGTGVVGAGTGNTGPGAGTPGSTNPNAGPGSTNPSSGNEVEPLKPQPPPDKPARPDPGPSRPDRSPAKPLTPEGFFGASRMQLRPMPFDQLVRELEYAEDTDADLRSEIDKLCATIVDFDAGGDANIARRRLGEIGKPAVPKVLSAFLHTGGYKDRKGMINSCYVDGTLRELVGSPRGLATLTPMASPGESLIKKTIKNWYIWWYTMGYQMDSYDLGGDEEEDEEE